MLITTDGLDFNNMSEYRFVIDGIPMPPEIVLKENSKEELISLLCEAMSVAEKLEKENKKLKEQNEKLEKKIVVVER